MSLVWKVDTTNKDGICKHCISMAASPFPVLDGGWDGWGTEYDDW